MRWPAVSPEVPNPKLVAPNMLSAVDTSERFLPMTLAAAGDQVDIVGNHDYDRRGHRWAKMRQVAGDRPVWVTEYCFNGRDESPGLIRSAGEFWLAMTEAFNDGVNVWMAYDWVYPPRQGGEALIHVGWGREYTLTKIYHGFRQWCAPLRPGHARGGERGRRPGRLRYRQTGREGVGLRHRGRSTFGCPRGCDPGPAGGRCGADRPGSCYRARAGVADQPGRGDGGAAARAIPRWGTWSTTLPGRGLLTLVIDRP
jgi:hypothetical protein